MPTKPAPNPKLERSTPLPDRAGVRALLETCGATRFEISLGRVCGSRVSAVWLGESLNLCSVTLEAHELDDAPLATARALEFIGEIELQLDRAS